MSISSTSIDASEFVSATPIPRSVCLEVVAEVLRLGLGEHFPAVLELTRELFGEDFAISTEPDPEIADWSDVVFTVQTRGTLDEILEKNTQWHRRLPHATVGAGGAFCLSIDAKP
jgi:hypothetical protein